MMKAYNEEDYKIWGIPVTQNQQDFVIGVFTISKLLKFTRYTKRLILGYDEDNEPVYNLEIQRNVEKGRVEAIADFLIDEKEATFPTNIVLHIPNQVIKKQIKGEKFLDIYLENKVFSQVEVAKTEPLKADLFISIIDGQHRIKGIEFAIEKLHGTISNLRQTLIKNPSSLEINRKLEFYQKRLTDLMNIQVVVSFFIDKTLEYQAMIFSTINRTQKRVSESLVYSLFGITTNDSPQKTSLEVVLALNAHQNSPFFDRINLYGETYDTNQSPPLTQAAMVKSVLALISENLRREAEADRRKDRKALLIRNSNSSKPLPFRRYYATNQDQKISDIMFYFFSAVKDTFTDANGKSLWTFNPENMKPTNVLHTTVGYQALMKILVDILQDLVNEESSKFDKSVYAKFLSRTRNLVWNDVQRYPFTSRTAQVLYLDMSLNIWPYQVNNNDSRLQKLKELLEK